MRNNIIFNRDGEIELQPFENGIVCAFGILQNFEAYLTDNDQADYIITHGFRGNKRYVFFERLQKIEDEQIKTLIDGYNNRPRSGKVRS